MPTRVVAPPPRCHARFATRLDLTLRECHLLQDSELLPFHAEGARRITPGKVVPRLPHVDPVLAGTRLLRRCDCDVLLELVKPVFLACVVDVQQVGQAKQLQRLLLVQSVQLVRRRVAEE